jgi:hypothetical protein
MRIKASWLKVPRTKEKPLENPEQSLNRDFNARSIADVIAQRQKSVSGISVYAIK